MNSLSPKDIEAGTIFYECDSGYNMKLKVTTVPVSSTEEFLGEEG